MRNLPTLLKSTRGAFLVLTPVCVFLGVTVAASSTFELRTLDILLVLLGATAAHICVNTLNEYLDFKSGLDAITTRTPFSGGSGALIANPDALNGVLYVAIATLAITLLTGLYFIISRGLLIVPIGVCGILIILTYTRWLNRLPWLCLLAPGIAFGPLMVVGTYVALTGEYSGVAFYASLLPLFLTSNLLLLNQYPDVSADQSVGRKTLPIVYGVRTSTVVYAVFASLAAAVLVAGVQLQFLPASSLTCLIPLAAAVPVLLGATKYARSADKLTPFLALNVGIALLAPLLLGLSIIVGLI